MLGPVRTLALTGLVALCGCYTVGYRTHATVGERRYEERANFYLWGFVGEKDVNLDEVCPEGPQAWRTEQTFWDGFFAVITLGVYSPRHVVVQCAGPK